MADSITVLFFPQTFQTACDANGIHELVVMWIFQFFENTTKKAGITVRMTTKEDRRNKQNVKLTSYPQVVNYLLLMYATDELISEVDA